MSTLESMPWKHFCLPSGSGSRPKTATSRGHMWFSISATRLRAFGPTRSSSPLSHQTRTWPPACASERQLPSASWSLSQTGWVPGAPLCAADAAPEAPEAQLPLAAGGMKNGRI